MSGKLILGLQCPLGKQLFSFKLLFFFFFEILVNVEKCSKGRNKINEKLEQLFMMRIRATFHATLFLYSSTVLFQFFQTEQCACVLTLKSITVYVV